MQEWVPTYIAEIKKQRRRLRNNMSEAAFKTWHARTLSVLECVPGMAPLQSRFGEIPYDNAPLNGRIREARRILISVVEFIESPVFGASKIVHTPLPQAGGLVIMPQMTQVQNVTQSISLDLETLLKRVDEQANLPVEHREEAKSLVKKLWDYLKGGAKDMATFADITTRLVQLGINIQQLLRGLQLS